MSEQLGERNLDRFFGEVSDLVPTERKLYDPHQPRDPEGKWVEAPGGSMLPASMEEWALNLAPELKATAAAYSFNTYAPMNEGLRKAKGRVDKLPAEGDLDNEPGAAPIPLADEVRKMDRVMVDANLASGGIPAPLMVHRGGDDPQIARLFKRGKLQGARYQDHGFMSTSLDEGTGEEFAQISADNVELDKGKRPMEILHEISLPKGTWAAYISPMSDFPEQDELVVRRGAYLEVTGWSYDAQNDRLNVRSRVLN
jgi:hypothetical protein